MATTIQGTPVEELLELERSRFHLMEARRHLLEAADRLLHPLPEFAKADSALMDTLARVRQMFDQQFREASAAMG